MLTTGFPQQVINAYTKPILDHKKTVKLTAEEQQNHISLGLAVALLIQTLDEKWRDNVYRGLVDADEETSLAFRDTYAVWLEATYELIASSSSLLRGISELQEFAAVFRDKVKTWRAPTLAIAVGFRAISFTEKGAAAFREIMAKAQKNPPVIPSGPQTEEIPLEQLLAQLDKR